MPIVGKLKTVEPIFLVSICQEMSTKITDISMTWHEYEVCQSDEVKARIRHIKYGEIYDAICKKYPEKQVETIDRMNEIYVSVIGSGGSDRVFETPHLDGPFCFLFGSTVLRCVCAIQGNSTIVTSFPQTGEELVLASGDFVAFDYNRDIHYIRQIPDLERAEHRIVLKLHYLVTPKNSPKALVVFYKWIHYSYNDLMRFLFLRSQMVDREISAKILAFWVNFFTIWYMRVFSWFLDFLKNKATLD